MEDDTRKILDKLSEQIAVDQKKLTMEGERLQVDRDRLDEIRIIRSLYQNTIDEIDATRQETRSLIETVGKLLEKVMPLSAYHEAVDDIAEELELIGRRLDQITESVSLLLTIGDRDSVAASLLNKISRESEMANLRRALRQHQRNLSVLQDRRAKYGIDVPLGLINEIEEISDEIGCLKEEIAKIEDETKDG